MIRILAVALAAGLAFAPTASFAKHKGAMSHAGQKVCKHTFALTGQTKTWSCGTNQPCCANDFLSIGQCGSKELGCL